eukprot:CAMPEP_0198146762 /NCGR_PEP_ID=MMETSP1443-20131203/31294_1 /TAXON_ID=186043 /ORGANISM="Entomoneis sp., Strain CCMP2396" /LENGTH=369 /DNA_ID=CAMNT_0043810835 /DNA_START=66 /DNA_END=1175 /DNA_ORIENTATION=+
MPYQCKAWGKLGHQTVANVAWDLLDESTQNSVRRLLDGSSYPDVHAICAEPCSPLAYVADWADTARYSKEYHWSGNLHYIDIQDEALPPQCQKVAESTNHEWIPSCRFVPTRDCPDGVCVSGSIVNYTQQLMPSSSSEAVYGLKNIVDHSSDDVARKQKVALMFVAHFVGDIHQPLHVSRQSDRGGNTIEVHLANWTKINSSSRRRRGRAIATYPGRNPRVAASHKLNLHAVWDDSLIETFLARNPGNSMYLRGDSRSHFTENRTLLEQKIHTQIKDAQTSGTTWASWMSCPYGHVKACTDAWAQESWLLAEEFAYVHVCGRQVESGDALEPDYYERNMHIVLERLAAAAVRLAATLEVALSQQMDLSR